MEDYHTKDMKEENVRLHTREVVKMFIPTGLGYGNFDIYQMRRSVVDDSGVLLKLAEHTINQGDFEIIKRYPRDDEWKTVEWLSRKVFCNLGVRIPDFMWPDNKDKYFQDRVRNTDMDVLIHLKEKLTDEAGLGSLFG